MSKFTARIGLKGAQAGKPLCYSVKERNCLSSEGDYFKLLTSDGMIMISKDKVDYISVFK